jgi:hypothetical protein
MLLGGRRSACPWTHRRPRMNAHGENQNQDHPGMAHPKIQE